MNAIIMAAGLGSRFKEMTKNQHKALLPINEIPNLERTIEFLIEAGITEIHLLTGYKAESFHYLKDKHPKEIFLHENKDYAKYNNIYTFSFGIPYFGDSFVIDADTVFTKNIFQKPLKSTYFTMIRKEDEVEWCPVMDEKGRVVEMRITDEKLPAMTGLTYWSKEDAEKIKEVFPEYMKEEILLNSKGYWDDIPVALFPNLDVTTKELPKGNIYEMDTQKNYFDILDMFAEKRD